MSNQLIIVFKKLNCLGMPIVFIISQLKHHDRRHTDLKVSVCEGEEGLQKVLSKVTKSISVNTTRRHKGITRADKSL